MVQQQPRKKSYDPNSLTFGGRLARKPELAYNQNSKPYTYLVVANNQGEDVNFITVFLYGKSAENAVQYLEVGRMVMVEGTIGSYTKQTAEGNRTEMCIRNARVYYMPSGGSNNSQSSGNHSNPAASNPQMSGTPTSHDSYTSGGIPPYQEMEEDDDLPF